MHFTRLTRLTRPDPPASLPNPAESRRIPPPAPPARLPRAYSASAAARIASVVHSSGVNGTWTSSGRPVCA